MSESKQEHGGGRSARVGAGFQPHAFGLDPFERLRIALRSGGLPRRRLAAGAIGLTAVTLVGAGVMAAVGSGPTDQVAALEATIAERQTHIAKLDADRKMREGELLELERRKSAVSGELAADSKRVAALEDRRESVQRQIAELTAPVSSSPGEIESLPVEKNAASIEAASDGETSPPAEGLEPVTSHPAPVAAPERISSQKVAARNSDKPTATLVDDEVQPQEVNPARTGALRVFIHVRSSDAAAVSRARAVAAELERRGVTVAQIRGVPYPVRRNAVRFFHDDDRAAVSTLQRAVRQASQSGDPAPQPQDFRSYGAPPKPGTLELWLS